MSWLTSFLAKVGMSGESRTTATATCRELSSTLEVGQLPPPIWLTATQGTPTLWASPWDAGLLSSATPVEVVDGQSAGTGDDNQP